MKCRKNSVPEGRATEMLLRRGRQNYELKAIESHRRSFAEWQSHKPY
ncbi:MAG: hypothetical protein ACOCWJ_03840 [Verrucomicrobiota bacterium]